MSFSIPNFLLKKTLGVANTLYTGTDITTETPGVTFPKVFASSQLFPYPIPPVAPTAPDTVFSIYSNTVTINGTSTIITINASTPLNAKRKSANPDLVFSGYIDANGGTAATSTTAYGLMYTSKTYPWIQYVDRLQMTVAQNTSYSYGPNSLLATSIPGNYDVVGTTYAIIVNTSTGTWANSSNVVPGSQYIIEKDAGYIYFSALNWRVSGTSLSASAIPLVSFYRYNGTMGIPTNLGNFAGAYLQGTGAIAYGDSAGYTGQGTNAISIGNFAGAYGQGTGSIAIGYLAGPTGMSANSIALNASGVSLNATGPTGGFYVAPIASYSGSVGPFTLLAYGADKQIVGITGAGMASMGILTVGGITGATGSFTALGATTIVTSSITGATGSFTALGATTITTNSITGATGSFTALGATTITTNSITGATGSFTALGATTINTNSITGATGSFTALGATTIATSNITGATGSFTALDATNIATSNITGATGSFTALGATTINTTNIAGATGYFTFLGAQEIIGTTGIFNFLVVKEVEYVKISHTSQEYSVTGMTGAIGYFTDFGAVNIVTTSITGATGLFTALGATTIATSSITGATGSFKVLAAGTGYIENVVTSKIGTNAGYIGQGVNALAMGNLAGAYGQGTGSIAIGYLAGPTGMSANSIVLNASGTALYGTGPTGGFYVAPIASYKNASNPTGPFQLLAYGPDNQIVTVTGATGLNLSLSTPTVTYDSWLLANLINPPPAPVTIKEIKRPNDYFILFNYPHQTVCNFTNLLLPLITTFNFKIGNSTVSLSGLPYVKSSLNDVPVNGIRFFQNNTVLANNSISTYIYNDLSYKIYNYNYNLNNASGLIWYSSNNTQNLVQNYTSFTLSYANDTINLNSPGTPLLSFNSNNDLVFNVPLSDFTNNIKADFINTLSYEVDITPQSGNGYNISSRKITINNDTMSTGNPKIIILGLSPDTTFTVSLKTTNINLLSSTTPSISITTPSPFTIPFVNTNTITGNLSSNKLATLPSIYTNTVVPCKKVGDTANTLYDVVYTSNVSFSVPFNIQNSITTRGNLSSSNVSATNYLVKVSSPLFPTALYIGGFSSSLQYTIQSNSQINYPSVPTFTSVSDASSITLSFNVPKANSSVNVNAGSDNSLSYTISYTATTNSTAYPTLDKTLRNFSVLNDITNSGNSKTIKLSSLYPDTTYLISLTSTNINLLSSTTPSRSITTGPLTIPFVNTNTTLTGNLSSNKLATLPSIYTNAVVPCKKVGDTTNTLYDVIYKSNVSFSVPFNIQNSITTRGNLSASNVSTTNYLVNVSSPLIPTALYIGGFSSSLQYTTLTTSVNYPSVPTFTSVSDTSSITLSFNAPMANSSVNVNAGSGNPLSYTISYMATANVKSYNTLDTTLAKFTVLNDTTISGNSKTIKLSSLYPDTTYLISLTSTNINLLSSTTPSRSITTGPLTIPFVNTNTTLTGNLSSNKLATYTNAVVPCKKVGDTMNTLYDVVYKSDAVFSVSFNVQNSVTTRGTLSASNVSTSNYLVNVSSPVFPTALYIGGFSSSLQYITFTTPISSPSVPTFTSLSDTSTITLLFNAPMANSSININAGTMNHLSYEISYTPTTNSISYAYATLDKTLRKLSILNDTTITGNSKTIKLDSLYPDTTYSISLKSTNIGSLSSITPSRSITTSALTIPFVKTYTELECSLSSNKNATLPSIYTNTVVSCKKVGDTTNTLYDVVYKTNVSLSVPFNIQNSVTTRGTLSALNVSTSKYLVNVSSPILVTKLYIGGFSSNQYILV